ncbi:MAG TPA: hypothetical protein V6C81_10575 [Planktothrix sp.]|jgi:hypothetical protein
MSRTESLLFGFVTAAVIFCQAASAQVRSISPPEDDFYAKEIDCSGVKIKAPNVVADAALVEAAKRLHMMLDRIPEVRDRLISSGCELHIIGRNQETSDLPDMQKYKGKPFGPDQSDVDKRTRGVGGKFASCGEENLLHLHPDRYSDRDICVHEFAHTIMGYGVDDETRRRIGEQYKDSTERGLWKNMYAGTNDKEFFAELSMWYFGTRGDYGQAEPAPKTGPAWFKSYDPAAYNLLQQIYHGPITPESWPEAAVDKWPAVNASTSLVVLPVHAASEESSLRSIDGSVKTVLVIYNMTKSPVRLYWLDWQGMRKDYGEVPALGAKSLNTFATHPWVVINSKGQVVAIFVATSKPCAGRVVN